MAGNDDLHRPLKAINQTAARLREDVQKLTGEVTKIHTIVQEAAGTIRDAIQENIQAQAELKLMEHVMEVRSVKPQITAERDQIQTEQSELDERLSSIDERYQRRHRELDQTAAERIRELGSHIFAIDEEEFDEGIRDPFTEQVTGAWHILQQHNEDIREERRMGIKGAAADTTRTIDDFVGRQESLISAIEDHRFDPGQVDAPSVEKPTRLQVPYYVVRFERNGVTERRVVVPSHVEPGGNDDWCSVRLSALDGAAELLGDADSVGSATANQDTMSADAIVDELSKYGETTLLGQSYAAEARKTLSDEVPVHIEGGDP
jgi:hypothetical protein